MLSAAVPRRRVLAIMHHKETSTGLLGELLRDEGAELDVRRPRYGDALPPDMERHDAVLILGGHMSVNDADEWLRREIEWLGVALRADVPVLGICLGAQMIAAHMGARVARHPEGRVEIGFEAVHATAAGLRCAGPRASFPTRFCQWHREGFDLPRGATLLASGDTFSVQAFSHGNAFAFQYHPEVTDDILMRWLAHGEDDLRVRCDVARREHVASLRRHQPGVATWLSAFLKGWLAPATERAVPSFA